MNYKYNYLLANYTREPVTYTQAAKITGADPQVIQRDLAAWITEDSGLSFKMKSVTTVEWLRFFDNVELNELVFNEEERVKLIYLFAYSNFTHLSVFYFQQLLNVSKGTVLHDIKVLRQSLADQGIELAYDRKEGFYVRGVELTIRLIAWNYVSALLTQKNCHALLHYWLGENYPFDFVARIKDTLAQKMAEDGLKLVPSREAGMVIATALTWKRFNHFELEYHDEAVDLQKVTAYQTSQATLTVLLGPKIEFNEINLFAIYLITISEGKIQDEEFNFLLQCVVNIINDFESRAAIKFTNYRELMFNIFSHLVPAYFRIKHGIQVDNVAVASIKHEYAAIYRLTDKSLGPLRHLTGKEIPEAEVSLFTILFGGALMSASANAPRADLTAYVICPNGVSSSLILQTELARLFPTINFKKATTVADLETVAPDDYDILFSTIKVETTKKLYVVRPIMSQLEKNELLNRVQKDWFIPGMSLPNVAEIVRALEPYIEFKPGVNKEKLYKVLNKRMTQWLRREEDTRPMLAELLTADTIQVVDNHDLSWEDAIALSAQPLLKQGKIEARYIDSMIDKVKNFGPFINIGDHVAMPHARPEDGVNEVGMALLKLTNDVNLLDDEKHPVNLFICLAAVDNDAHLRALASLTKLLSQKDVLQRLTSAQSVDELLAIINEGDEA